MDKRIKNKKLFPHVKNFRKCLLKVGDEVKIITGNEKGQVGKIIDFDRKRGKIKIEGKNLKTHFTKRTQEQPGKMEQKEGFISVSNVQFFENGVITRLARDENRKRISVKTKKEV